MAGVGRVGGLPARGVLPPVGQGEEGRPPRGALHGQVLNLKLHPPYKYSDVQGQSNRQVGFILVLNPHQNHRQNHKKDDVQGPCDEANSPDWVYQVCSPSPL